MPSAAAPSAGGPAASSSASSGPSVAPTGPRRRRPATPAEAKALAHPVRQDILRLTGERDRTNRELADALGLDPATTLHHVRRLVDAGLLEPRPARTGARGSREKPYRSTGVTWWLDAPLATAPDDVATAPVRSEAARIAGADAADVVAWDRITLHLDAAGAAELERRVLDVLDEYAATDATRRDLPAHSVLVAVRRVRADATSPDATSADTTFPDATSADTTSADAASAGEAPPAATSPGAASPGVAPAAGGRPAVPTEP